MKEFKEELPYMVVNSLGTICISIVVSGFIAYMILWFMQYYLENDLYNFVLNPKYIQSENN